MPNHEQPAAAKLTPAAGADLIGADVRKVLVASLIGAILLMILVASLTTR